MDQTEKQDKIKLIYIGGYGHSGSTILEILLSCNAKTKGLGELFRFGEALTSKYTKELFKKSPNCYNMYTLIESNLAKKGESLQSFKEVRSCEKFTYSSSEDLDRYHRLWSTYLRAAQNGDNSVILVDSSKSSFGVAKRFKHLQSLNEVQAHMIHLVRHPKPILVRMLKKRRKQSFEMSTFQQVLYLFKYSMSWLFSNIWPVFTSKNKKYIRISFEQLCEQPERTLNKIGEKLDIDLSEAIRRIHHEEILPTTCAITGNMRVRRNKNLKFTPSKKTIPETDFTTSLIALMVTPFYYILK